MADKRKRQRRSRAEPRVDATATTPRDAQKATASVPSAPTSPVDPRRLEQNVTWGAVVGYTVSSKGLIIKVDVGAISRLAFFISADAPHFKSAVSIAMLAHNERRNASKMDDLDQRAGTIWVKYGEGLPEDRPERRLISGNTFLIDALELGLGMDDPFEIDDWVMSPNWIDD